jgi:hypothetical protein
VSAVVKIVPAGPAALPGSQRHFLDTMRRIPDGRTGHTVFDNLAETTWEEIAQSNGLPGLTFLAPVPKLGGRPSVSLLLTYASPSPTDASTAAVPDRRNQRWLGAIVAGKLASRADRDGLSATSAPFLGMPFRTSRKDDDGTDRMAR